LLFTVMAASMLIFNTWLASNPIIANSISPLLRFLNLSGNIKQILTEFGSRISFILISIPTVAFTISVIHGEGEVAAYSPFRIAKVMLSLFTPIAIFSIAIGIYDLAIGALFNLFDLRFSPVHTLIEQLHNIESLQVVFGFTELAAIYLIGICLKTVAMIAVNNKKRLDTI